MPVVVPDALGMNGGDFVALVIALWCLWQVWETRRSKPRW